MTINSTWAANVGRKRKKTAGAGRVSPEPEPEESQSQSQRRGRWIHGICFGFGLFSGTALPFPFSFLTNWTCLVWFDSTHKCDTPFRSSRWSLLENAKTATLFFPRRVLGRLRSVSFPREREAHQVQMSLGRTWLRFACHFLRVCFVWWLPVRLIWNVAWHKPTQTSASGFTSQKRTIKSATPQNGQHMAEGNVEWCLPGGGGGENCSFFDCHFANEHQKHHV